MADAITIKALQDASLDAKSLEEVVNGDDARQVTTRLGETYPSVKKAIKTMFENGGLPATPFETKAQMTSEGASLPDGQLAMVHNETANNGLYVKTAGTWVKSDYDPFKFARNYTDDSVLNFVDSILRYSPNLLKLDSFAEEDINKSFIRNTGELQESDTYSIHPFIEVEPGGKYRLSAESVYTVAGMGVYDANKEYIRFTELSLNDDGYNIITIPSNVHYIRPQTRDSVFNVEYKPMLVKGEDALPYEPWRNPELKDVRLNGEMEGVILDIAKNEAKEAKEFLDNHVVMPVNLFVKENVLLGKRVDNKTGEVLDSSSSHYFVTEYIPVKPDTIYTATAEGSQTTESGFFNFIYFYDKDKNYISYAFFNSQVSVPISRTTPKNTAYVLISSLYAVDRVERTFVEGSDTTHRPRTNALLYNVDMEEGFFDDVYSEVYSRVHYLLSKPFYYDTDFSKTYTVERDLTKYAPYAQKTSAEVYAAFDLLMANSNGYITKERLNDSVLGEEISAYTLNPPTFLGVGDGQTDAIDQRPTVLIMCGTHGHENLPIFTAYAFANEICNEWLNDDMLAALRFNVRFIIVPIANPDGWRYNPPVEGITRGRKNANGVDIARNFPSSYWGAYPDPDSKTYSGPSAGSEVETQNIIGLFERNKIDIFYDFHNFQERSAESITGTMSWILYHPAVTPERTAKTLKAYFSKHTRLMHKQVGMPPNWTAGRGEQYYFGTPMEYGAEAGAILSTTLEFNLSIPYSEQYSDTLHENFDAMHSKVTFEAFINWVTTCVDEIGSRF